MNFCIGITIDLLEDLLSCPSGPDEFFDQLIVSLQHSNSDMDFTFQVIRAGRSTNDAVSVLDCYLISGDGNADTALSPIRLAMLLAKQNYDPGCCSISLFESQRQHKAQKSRLDFILSSRSVSLTERWRSIPSYVCQFQWDDHSDLINMLRDPHDSKSYWCFDYDETLFSSLQGYERFNGEVLGYARNKLKNGSGCILTARTDPGYLYGLIKSLIVNSTEWISVPISLFNRKQFEELTADRLDKLDEQVNDLLKLSTPPGHRKALLKDLMSHFKDTMLTGTDDRSPWDVEALPLEGLMFFMNTRVQMIINDHVAHLERAPLLKGEFARWMLRRNPDLSEVVLIDDSHEQCLDWVEVGSKVVAYRMTQSFLSNIPVICQEIHEVRTVDLNRFFLMLSDQAPQISKHQGMNR